MSTSTSTSALIRVRAIPRRPGRRRRSRRAESSRPPRARPMPKGGAAAAGRRSRRTRSPRTTRDWIPPFPRPRPPALRSRGARTPSPPPVTSTPYCAGCSSECPSKWYTVRGTGGEMLASTCGYAAYDTRIIVLAGQCGALSCVGTRVPTCAVQCHAFAIERSSNSLTCPCPAAFPLAASDDDTCGSSSQVRWDSVAGETYRNQVTGFSSSHWGL
jgi:hypothetical protein